VCVCKTDSDGWFQIKVPKKAPGPEETVEYNKRFTNPLWNNILLLAWDYSGGTFNSDSTVYPYRERDRIVS